MAESKQQNLDQLIREVLDEKMEEFPPPRLSTSEAWRKMEDEHQVAYGMPKKNRFPKKTILAVASIFLVLIVAAYPREGGAYSRWSEIYHKVQGSVVQVFGGSGEYTDTENSDSGMFVIEDSEPIFGEMSLEEAQKVTSFAINIPEVPTEFQLEKVIVMREGDQMSNEVYLNYVSDDREFVVAEKKLGGQYAFGGVADSEDTVVEEILIHGQTANMLSFKDGIRRLTWLTQSNYFYIEGILTKEEVVKIAESM
ncbi:DUF4367 domain-containing protein [Sporosarcina beigongshangi]|uniref:DUF4367 domain-containing protein n=1 Tax=Sporosarcina beigongshangi TaxID=2782538 RepID=UPI00193A6D30|nr:DUF4367 domain-containing protein [Sporosarcina beigongshangi]